jgi:hypothetical protein
VQSWPSIGRRPTVRNRPATSCSPSDFASGIDYSSSSASPKFTTGSPPISPAQIGEANQRARRRVIVGSIDPVSEFATGAAGGIHMETPPPFQESANCDVCRCTFSTFRRRVRIRSLSHPCTHFLSGCCESHRRSAGSSGNTMALIF